MKRPWECWKHPEYGRQYLKQWGTPNDISTWQPGVVYRFTRAADLIIGDSVLDVGCGIGHLYQLVRGQVSYIGIDNTPVQIEIAKEFFPDADFFVADLYSMPEIPRCDTVVSLSVLLHLPDLPLERLWEKAKMCLIFDMFIGDESKVEKIEYAPYGYFLKHIYEKNHLISICESLVDVEGVDFYESAISKPAGSDFAFIRIRREHD